ncbi:hypothetical protein NQ318_015699 [Aromia moschata]|uniref:DUF4817 domain-containing protein n=1 Tax=Aromia moschata TaxID=1265417 RepID=A0AAV8YJ75_9CUCU|nr:hypothetical protein NQ318_015699 [Aromia moschata]
MSLTQEEMVDMVFVLGACHRNPLLASRVYAQRYPDRRHPRKYSFQLVLDRFVNTGSIQHIKRNRSNNVVTEENEFLVLGCIQENPETSVRQISHTTGISATSLDQDVDFFTRVMFSDEATFHKNGFVNRHNCHNYDTVNPHQFQTISEQRWNVWGGILGSHVIGPFFFDQHLTGAD